MSNYERINWTAGTKVKEGYTIINGQEYQTVQPEYSGETPINVENLNHMDEQLENLSIDYIVEQGTDYIKYNSGLMVQWGKASVTGALQTANGPLYRTSSVVSQNFPQPFIDNNTVITLTPHAALAVAYLGTITTTSFEFWPNTLVSSSSGTRYVSWHAIGKWK